MGKMLMATAVVMALAVMATAAIAVSAQFDGGDCRSERQATVRAENEYTDLSMDVDDEPDDYVLWEQFYEAGRNIDTAHEAYMDCIYGDPHFVRNALKPQPGSMLYEYESDIVEAIATPTDLTRRALPPAPPSTTYHNPIPTATPRPQPTVGPGTPTPTPFPTATPRPTPTPFNRSVDCEVGRADVRLHWEAIQARKSEIAHIKREIANATYEEGSGGRLAWQKALEAATDYLAVDWALYHKAVAWRNTHC